MKKTYSAEVNGYYFPEGECKGDTVYLPDEVQLSTVLGPDGSPYAIRRNKFKVGFDLSGKRNTS